jgi:hypothetical protein
MRLRSSILAAIAMLAFGATAAQAGSPPTVTTAPVISLDAFTPVPGASSTIVRTDDGANFRLNTSGLPAGHAITLWLVIFNNPTACATPHACDEPDLGNPATQASVIYGTGRVIGGQGTVHYAGHISVGNLNRPSSLPDEMQRVFGPGLTSARGADFLLVVHDHFDAQPGIISQQIHSFGVGCPDNDGFKCIDRQVSYNAGV